MHDLRRKLRNLVMDPTCIDTSMSPNVLDVLAIAPKSEMSSKGMPHVKRVIDSIGLISSSQDLIENIMS